MRHLKKAASILAVTALVLSLSVTALAATEEKKVEVEGSKDGYVTVSNVTSEKTIDKELVYYATAPVKVTFNGSDLASELIYRLPNAKLSDTEITLDDVYSEVTFDVIKYKLAGDETVYDKNEKQADEECTYVSGNYAVLKEAGVYSVSASPAAVAGTGFYIVVAAEEVPEETEPEATVPAPAETATAKPTASNVMVNGEKVVFDAYNINDNNYFKLRDLAKVLSGTEKQFEVTWDGENKAINLESGKAYTVVGGEMAAGADAQVTAALNKSIIYQDGEVVSLTAYTINDNNYFKLRDLGQAFDFGVTWNGETNTITIDTATGYTPEEAPANAGEEAPAEVTK